MERIKILARFLAVALFVSVISLLFVVAGTNGYFESYEPYAHGIGKIDTNISPDGVGYRSNMSEKKRINICYMIGSGQIQFSDPDNISPLKFLDCKLKYNLGRASEFFTGRELRYIRIVGDHSV